MSVYFICVVLSFFSSLHFVKLRYKICISIHMLIPSEIFWFFIAHIKISYIAYKQMFSIIRFHRSLYFSFIITFFKTISPFTNAYYFKKFSCCVFISCLFFYWDIYFAFYIIFLRIYFFRNIF